MLSIRLKPDTECLRCASCRHLLLLQHGHGRSDKRGFRCHHQRFPLLSKPAGPTMGTQGLCCQYAQAYSSFARYAGAVLAFDRCLYVCVSVCLSVCLLQVDIVSRRLKASSRFSPGRLPSTCPLPVSYTHLTLPTNREV